MSNEAKEIIERMQDGGAVLLFLDTSEIVESDVTNVRPWTSKESDEEELKKIELLAETIQEEGQIQPVVVRKNGNGKYELVAGRRRKRAIELINAGREKGKELKVSAVVSVSANQNQNAFRQATIEKIHREQINPMDMAVNINNVREKFGWKGTKETAKVAAFFKVSKASVIQYEKLLQLPVEVQKKVHKGELTRDDAFKLSQIHKDEGEEAVLHTASHAIAIGSAVEQSGGTKKEVKAAKSNVIKRAAKEVKDAKRKAKGKEVKPEPRSRREIIEFFEGMQGPAYGFPNGDVHVFVAKFMDWCKGEIADSTLEKYWMKMVVSAYKGKAEVNVVTAARGKTVSKPKK